MTNKKKFAFAKAFLHTIMPVLFLLSISGCGTSLHEAIRTGNNQKAKSLIAKADVNKRDQIGWTPLHWAATKGQDEIVELLINKGARVNEQGSKGAKVTPLWQAAANGHVSTVRLLVDNGALDIPTSTGATPMMVAANRGYLDIVKMLISKGADADHKDKEGEDALDYALFGWKMNVVEYFVKNGRSLDGRIKEPNAVLLEASFAGCIETVKIMISQGTPADCINEDETTPLMLAAAGGSLETVHYLLAQGADVNRKNKVGNSPLLLAAMNGRGEVVKTLIDAGADIQISDNQSLTPVFRAALEGHKEVMIYLIERGQIDINQKSKEVGSLMHAAARNDHTEIVEYFIDRGLKPFVFVNEGNLYDIYSTAFVHQLMAEHYISNNNPCEEVTDCLKIASEYYNRSAEGFKSIATSIGLESFKEDFTAAFEDGLRSGIGTSMLHIAGATNLEYRHKTTLDHSKELNEETMYKRLSKRCEKRHRLCNKAIEFYRNNELDSMLECFEELREKGELQEV